MYFRSFLQVRNGPCWPVPLSPSQASFGKDKCPFRHRIQCPSFLFLSFLNEGANSGLALCARLSMALACEVSLAEMSSRC